MTALCFTVYNTCVCVRVRVSKRVSVCMCVYVQEKDGLEQEVVRLRESLKQVEEEKNEEKRKLRAVETERQ